ncbi:MAG: non-homologous end-joining DNA ligase [Ilumatobacteraceae bacterium]
MTTWPVLPMKARSGQLPLGEDWVYEPKWDGHRLLVRVRGDRIDAISSTGKPRTLERWPWLGELVAIDAEDTVLDGEVVAYDESGAHRFQLVGRGDRPHSFVVFDVLTHVGADLFAVPWSDRRSLLESIVRPAVASHVSLTPVTTDAEAIVRVTREAGMEGIVAKRSQSPYQPGLRSTAWRKVKHRRVQELVVGGWLVGQGTRAATFGSLLLGVHDDEGRLRFAGAVGTGFDDRSLRQLSTALRTLAVPECPFDPPPALARGRARWVRPELVVQVAFGEWTLDGMLRHPVYLGLRDDRSPADVVREP